MNKFLIFINIIIVVSCSTKSVHVNEYYENRELKESGYLINEKKTGVWKVYNKSGILISEISYKKGKKHGMLLDFHTNGIISSVCNYKKGKQDSDLIMFYPNGQRNLHEYYNGKYVFKACVWYKNGQIKQIGSFNKNGEMDEIWKRYQENGILSSVESYIDGDKDGFWYYFNEYGDTISCLKYVNNQITDSISYLR